MQVIASTEPNKSREEISQNTCPVKLHQARFRVKSAKTSILDEEEKILETRFESSATESSGLNLKSTI